MNIAGHSRRNSLKIPVCPAARTSNLELQTSNPLPLCFHTLTNPFSRNSFRFTSIQIPRGGGTLLPFSPLVYPERVFAKGHLPLPFCFHPLTDSLSLFALFFRLPFFIFNSLRTLLPKHPGWWGWVLCVLYLLFLLYLLCFLYFPFINAKIQSNHL